MPRRWDAAAAKSETWDSGKTPSMIISVIPGSCEANQVQGQVVLIHMLTHMSYTPLRKPRDGDAPSEHQQSGTTALGG